MNRRVFGLHVGVAWACAFLVGCVPNQFLRKSLRDEEVIPSSATEEAKSERETDQILDVRSDGQDKKPFFKPSRRSGALSDEARDIERNLGVH